MRFVSTCHSLNLFSQFYYTQNILASPSTLRSDMGASFYDPNINVMRYYLNEIEEGALLKVKKKRAFIDRRIGKVHSFSPMHPKHASR